MAAEGAAMNSAIGFPALPKKTAPSPAEGQEQQSGQGAQVDDGRLWNSAGHGNRCPGRIGGPWRGRNGSPTGAGVARAGRQSGLKRQQRTAAAGTDGRECPHQTAGSVILQRARHGLGSGQKSARHRGVEADRKTPDGFRRARIWRSRQFDVAGGIVYIVTVGVNVGRGILDHEP